jgi:hypothetical protein
MNGHGTAWRVWSKVSFSPQQVRQLGDVGGDAQGFVAGEQVARRGAPGLVLEIE